MGELDFLNAFTRPFSDATKMLIGLVIAIIPFVNFIFYGYVIENMKSVLGRRGLPEWKNWFDLLIEGLTGTIAALIYFLPTIIIALISMYSLVSQGLFTIEAIMNPLNWASLTGIGILLAVGIVFYLISLYIFPAVLVHYAAQNRFDAIFELDVIFKKVLSFNYLLSFLTVIVYSFVIGGVVSLLVGVVALFVPLLATLMAVIVGGITTYIIFITASTLFAQAYRG